VSNFSDIVISKVPLFRVIHQALRDKAVDNLCARFLSLGIDAQLLRQHPLKKASFGHRAKSLGLIQVDLKNIRYVKIIRFTTTKGVHPQAESTVWYEFDYLVPLTSIPCSLSDTTQLRLKQRHRLLNEDEVMRLDDKTPGWQWEGGPLANMLNSDSSLNSNLLTELRLDGPLGNLAIIPEPAYGCVRITTDAGCKSPGLGMGPLGGESIPRLPSRSSIDCLDRIAGHVIEIAKL